MNYREKKQLISCCEKAGIDEAEIDSSISLEENLEILGLHEKDPHHGEPEFTWFPDYCAAKLYDRCFATQHSTTHRNTVQRFSLEKYVASRKRG